MYRTRSIDMAGDRCDWERVSAESPAGAALAHVRGELRRGWVCFDGDRATLDVEVQEVNDDGLGIWERRWCCIVSVWRHRDPLGNVGIGSVCISADQPPRRYVTLTLDRGGLWRVEGEDWGDVALPDVGGAVV